VGFRVEPFGKNGQVPGPATDFQNSTPRLNVRLIKQPAVSRFDS
jgi:hypothetical protein